MNAPASLAELADAVRSMPRLLAVGAQTKPRLSAVDVPKLTTTRMSGIVEYDPGEFTFTALAGTPLRDIAAALAERGQYLPFDPMLLEAGSTLGGAVASGLSGPGRFRFGGLRDFILGVRFVDGTGRLLRMGGKVVKNAAGFDLPKFFVGSLGRFGVLGEITFKVFPRSASTLTLKLAAPSIEDAAKLLVECANARWEADALDIPPGGTDLVVRLAGPAAALQALAAEILARFEGEILSERAGASLWNELREFGWAHIGGPLYKVALSPAAVVPLALADLRDARIHFSAGGNVAFVSLSEESLGSALDERLQRLRLCGVGLRGSVPLWLGRSSRPEIATAVKRALDPENRFPSLED